MNTKNHTPYEEEEQVTFVNWLEYKGYKFSAIPNSTYTKSYNQKRKNYLMGLRKGLPDLLIILTADQTKLGRAIQVWIEMKRQKGGKVGDEQKEWIESLNQINDVEAFVCKGCDEAINTIKQFTRS